MHSTEKCFNKTTQSIVNVLAMTARLAYILNNENNAGGYNVCGSGTFPMDVLSPLFGSRVRTRKTSNILYRLTLIPEHAVAPPLQKAPKQLLIPWLDLARHLLIS